MTPAWARTPTVWNGWLTMLPRPRQTPGVRIHAMAAWPSTTTTPWPGESSWLSRRWLSENSPSNPAVTPQPHSVSILTPTAHCLTTRATTKRMIAVRGLGMIRALTCCLTTGWRNFQTESRPGLTASGAGAPPTSRRCPRGPSRHGCRGRWGPWTSQTSPRRSWARSLVAAAWSRWSRATCTRSRPRVCTAGSTWLCAATGWWLTTHHSKPTLTTSTARKSSWAMSLSKYRGKSRRGSKLPARGQTRVMNVTRRT